MGPKNVTGPSLATKILVVCLFNFPCFICQDVGLYGKTLKMSTDSYIVFDQNVVIPDLNEVSMCLWVRIPNPIVNHVYTFVSYFASGGHQITMENQYSSGDVKYKLLASLRKNSKWFVEGDTFTDWTFWCFTWSSTTSKQALYLDGLLKEEKDVPSPDSINGDGVLLFGQDQDSRGGGFQENQAFIGDMTEVNFWSRQISGQEIGKLMLCSSEGLTQGALVSWMSSKFTLHHIVDETEFYIRKQCFANVASGKTLIDGYNKVKMDRLLDGNILSCDGTSQSVQPWLRIDLDGVYFIRYVVLYVDLAYPADRSISVGVGFSKLKSDPVSSACETMERDAQGSVLQILLFCDDIMGQYVHFVSSHVQSVYSFNVCEVEVYAEFVFNCENFSNVVNQTIPGTDVGVIQWNIPGNTSKDASIPEEVNVRCEHEPGDLFPIGTTIEHCDTPDESGHLYICSFNITITDNENPKIASPCCNINEKLPHHTLSCKSVTWEEPIAQDNSKEVIIDKTSAPGDCFAKDTTEVTYVFYDQSANQANCSFNVTVRASCSLNLKGHNNLLNGNLIHGDMVKVSCEKGWKLDDERPVKCVDGALNGTMPICVDVDECIDGDHDCDFIDGNEYCHNTVGNYTCLCIPQYERIEGRCEPISKRQVLTDQSICFIDDNDLFCPQEMDEMGSLWPDTKAQCTTEWQRCPNNSTGLVWRTCDKYGNWEPADSTFCKSPILSEFSKKITSITSQEHATELVDSTADFLSEPGNILGGDLLSAVDVLQRVQETDPIAMSGSANNTVAFIDSYVKMANDLLDADMESHWKFIHEGKGIGKGSPGVFKTLDAFNDKVVTHVLLKNTRVYLKYDNLEYQAFQVTKLRKKMQWLSINGSRINSSRQKRTVDQLDDKLKSELVFSPDVLRSESNISVIITYVYRNPADVLPVSVHRSSKQRRVDSITATKKVQKVNSPVVAVKMYSDHTPISESETLTLKIPHKEVGYNAECVTMSFDEPSSVWKNDKCVIVKILSDEDHTTCQCSQPVIAAVVMTIGQRPQAFIVAAKDDAIALANGLAFSLVLMSTILLSLSGLTTDQYAVIWHFTVSCLPMPFFVFLGELTNSGKVYSISMAVIQFSFLATNAWILNLSIEAYRRLASFIHSSRLRRLPYIVIGWVLPLTVTLICLWIKIDVYHQGQSFWFPTFPFIVIMCVVIVAAMNLISIVLLYMAKRSFDKDKRYFEYEEWHTFWAGLRTIMVTLPVTSLTWFSGTFAITTGNLAAGYIFAGLSFSLGSMIFLAYCATNTEVLTAIRIKFQDDVTWRAALKEHKQIEHARFDRRKSIRESTRKLVQERDEVTRRNVTQKHRRIVTLFDEATKKK
ncbi:uncharacterized protein [Ptychodera flava]|uniref:uncharacterized protein n=1 Tax=Ptychodera flava TaxID=63121 RepID=UPI003969C53B